MAEQPSHTFQVKGQAPKDAASPLYSNFLAVSRVGSDVQFEFIFLDLGQIASMMEAKGDKAEDLPERLEGKTIAKIVMPATSFIQLKDQFSKIMKAIDELLQQNPEVQHERSHARSR